MSLALLPRLHFNGTFETNVCTANNDDVVQAIDPVAVAIRFGENAASSPNQSPDTVPTTDAEFINWMRSVKSDGNVRSSWNYYGDHSCRFVNCKIVSVDIGGDLVMDSATDPAVGAAVILGENAVRKTGVMVDLNPEGTWGTQIFANRFQVVGGPSLGLSGPPSIACSRWLHFRRNLTAGGFTGAAATWQSVIPKASLKLAAGTTGALAELYAAAQTQAGVIIRYCTYLLSPKMDSKALLAAYQQGAQPENPAVGVVVGTMGVWDGEDFRSNPNGRLLSPRQDYSWNHATASFGPATAVVDEVRHQAVIDLITAIPETDASGTKIQAGPARLVVLPDSGGEPVSLGTLFYDEQSYRSGGGLQIVHLAPEQTALATAGSLAITFGDTLNLQEENLVLDTDDRNVYLDPGIDRQILLRLRHRGRIPVKPVTIRIAQYFNPLGKQYAGPIAAAVRAIAHPDSVTSNAQGEAAFVIRAVKPMLGFLHCTVDGSTEGPSPTLGCLINFRAFPADNYDHIPDDQLDFALIYKEVLRYYHVLYPAMTGIFSLADEQQVRDSADVILERITPGNQGSWGFMPRTREMSAGKRELLTRWLKKILS